MAPPPDQRPDIEIAAADLARAARILAVRTRREVSGLFAGSYTSAFRGGGMEFEESRPYVPGDDVLSIDWNATARTGEPYVKRFREERDQTLLLALDVSASMGFGTTGRAKAASAAHAAALLAAAAGRAGDRVGLIVFDSELRAEIPPARGAAHTWRVIRTAAMAAGAASGTTRLSVAAGALLTQARQRAVTVLISDFRDPALADVGNATAVLPPGFPALGRRHDMVSIAVHDRRDQALPSVGLVRLEDPEQPGRSLLLNSSSRPARTRYRRAWAARAGSLERALRSAGSDVLWLRTDRDPLRALMQLFAQRARRGAAAAEHSAAAWGGV